MLEYLQGIDTQWLLAINGMHSDYMDSFMWMVSKSYSWALIGIVAIVVNSRKGWRPALAFVLAVAIAVLIADQVSSGLIKHAVERLRPTHEPSLEGLIHLVRDYRGGLYGFVSSHAANSFAVAVLVGCIMPRRAVLGSLFAWAVLQCYSRMYLGVHYPGDILGGMLVGLAAGAVAYWAWLKATRRYCDEAMPTNADSWALVAATWASVVVLALVALF